MTMRTCAEHTPRMSLRVARAPGVKGMSEGQLPSAVAMFVTVRQTHRLCRPMVHRMCVALARGG